MTPRAKVVEVPRREASLYLGKAGQYLAGAKRSMQEDMHDAVMLSAIRAGISACDAVCVALDGRRSADPDHARAADLMVRIDPSSPELVARARQLRALLATKNKSEYQSSRANARDAGDALARAERLVAWAEGVVPR